jgi:lysozyme
MIQFGSDRIRNEWNNVLLNPVVKTIVNEAATYANARWQWDFFITSIYRTPQEDAALGGSGIHVAWRAVDARSSTAPAGALQDVTDYINGRWTYDPARPTLKVCFSEPHGTGPHMHFQSHAATIPVSTIILDESSSGVHSDLGIDISSHNGDIDWTRIKNNQQIKFVVIRLSLGYGMLDKKAYKNAESARNAGKKISYYHFAYPDPKSSDQPDILIDAKNEANYFRSLLDDLRGKGLNPDFSPVIDLEDDQNYQFTRKLSPLEYYNWIKTFLSYFSGPLYLPVMIYGSPAYLDSRLPPNHSLGNNPLWVANYSVSHPRIPRGWDKYTLWQYDEHGIVDGISGDCDLDSMTLNGVA